MCLCICCEMVHFFYIFLSLRVISLTRKTLNRLYRQLSLCRHYVCQSTCPLSIYSASEKRVLSIFWHNLTDFQNCFTVHFRNYLPTKPSSSIPPHFVSVTYIPRETTVVKNSTFSFLGADIDTFDKVENMIFNKMHVLA